MSKAVLVMEMPESCDCCSLYEGHYPDMYCCGDKSVTIRSLYPEKFKPKRCPLKPLPDGECTSNLWDEYDDGFVDGWNSFRSEIMGE